MALDLVIGSILLLMTRTLDMGREMGQEERIRTLRHIFYGYLGITILIIVVI